ncbi:hypothetical protein H920_15578 [Fukomys damarensis]|uniref:Uncharacterized protein n=1 Tax=Fukomys damarensis TaxID=885580 RepID=A0A091DJQ3_FUKDA|nr:hypothetical protein H920_15578 [Fukomys damarensis]
MELRSGAAIERSSRTGLGQGPGRSMEGTARPPTQELGIRYLGARSGTYSVQMTPMFFQVSGPVILTLHRLTACHTSLSQCCLLLVMLEAMDHALISQEAALLESMAKQRDILWLSCAGDTGDQVPEQHGAITSTIQCLPIKLKPMEVASSTLSRPVSALVDGGMAALCPTS